MNDRKGGRGNLLLSVAARNLKRHWVRSILATIGIIIGVIAIASLGILGNSIAILLGGFWADVSDAILITPHLAVSSGDPGDIRNVLPSTLSERDVLQIEKAVGPEHRVIPMIRTTGKIEFGDKTGFGMMYVLKSEDILFLLEPEVGTFPRGSTPSIMMGTFIADDYDISAGNRVQLDGRDVRVVGIVAERGWGIDINPDFAIIVTQEWYSGEYGKEEEFNQVVVKVRNIEDIDGVKEAVDSQLNRRKEVVDIVDSRELIEIFNDTLNGIRVMLVGIGAVSLLVASVSILNVMIISVTERTQEIGVLRSIGTRRRDVMSMFLYEAFILGVIGSVIGGLASSVVGLAVSNAVAGAFADLFGMEMEVSFFDPVIGGYILFGVVFGIVTSVIAGIYPSWKAANLNPIEALRYE
jgi:putative ABC transport system permease protein